jgi:hypothetical protein
MSLFSVGGKLLTFGEPLTFGAEIPGQLSLTIRGNQFLPCVGVNLICVCWPIYSGGIGPLSFSFANGTQQQNCSVANSGSFSISTPASRNIESLNNEYLYIVYSTGSVNHTQGETDTIELVVTDTSGNTAANSFTVTYTNNYALNLFVPDYLLTNIPVSYLPHGIGTWNCNSIPGTATNFTFLPDNTGYFTIQGGAWSAASNPTIVLQNNTEIPPPGIYSLIFGYSNPTFSQVVNIYVTSNNGSNAIYFVQTAPTISTSLPRGFVVGQLTASSVPDNIYSWSLNAPSEYFGVSLNGLVTILSPPTTAGTYTVSVQVSDLEAYYQTSISLAFVAGTVVSSSNMTATIPSGLTNAISSGVLTSPTVTGFTPKFWNFTIKYGSTWQTAPTFEQIPSTLSTSTSCGRYSMNNLTGEITIGVAQNTPNGNFDTIPLSYQVAGDGTSFEDEITIYATDFVNTCTKTVAVPVSAAIPSSNATYAIGPTTVLEANGISTATINSASGTVFSTLTDAFTTLGVGNHYPSSLEPGSTFICYSYPQNNSLYKTYYENDGFIVANGTAAGGTCGAITLYMPVTIMGAPGQPFPYFSATVQTVDGIGLVAGGMSKGFFYANAFDLTLKNLTVAFMQVGPGLGGSFAGICKEDGVISGNLTIDNCYIHDCSQGIKGGAVLGGKVFITNSRVSHCGIGEFGLSHNIYVNGDFVYVSNVQSDQAFVGHLIKSRAEISVIQNCRLIDGDLGCASNILELPNGGIATVTDNLLQKGPNSQNPYMLCYAFNGDNSPPLSTPYNLTPNSTYPNGVIGTNSYNTLTASGNTFILDPGSNAFPLNPENKTGAQDQNDDCYSQSSIFGYLNGSLQGFDDGAAAVMIVSGTSYYGLAASNYELVDQYQLPTTGPVGTITNTGTATTLARRPSTAGFNTAFPGTGPNPTVGDPPGPFINSWCVGNSVPPPFPSGPPAPLFNVTGQWYTGGGQIIAPTEPLTIPVGTAAGSTVGTVAWYVGESTSTSPTFSIAGTQGPNDNSFSIGSTSGLITTTAAIVAQSNPANPVDVLSIEVTSSSSEQLYWSLTIIAT